MCNRLATTQTQHQQTSNVLTDMLQSIEGVDQNQIGVQILALQTSLSASLSTTARLSQMSLLNYLAPVTDKPGRRPGLSVGKKKTAGRPRSFLFELALSDQAWARSPAASSRLMLISEPRFCSFGSARIAIVSCRRTDRDWRYSGGDRSAAGYRC